MSETIEIIGQVKDLHDQAPAFMIKVSIYRDDKFVAKEYTNDDGKYGIHDIPVGAPITVLFDTHQTLNNAENWHPSVIANIEAKQNLELNHFVTRVGTFLSDTAVVDALAAYQLCAVWLETQLPLDSEERREYAQHAAARLSRMKAPLVLQEIQEKLRKFFEEQS
jgi:hypothetical protein